MKKIYQSKNYKHHTYKKSKKGFKVKRRKFSFENHPHHDVNILKELIKERKYQKDLFDNIHKIVISPENLSFIENTEECLNFINKIRDASCAFESYRGKFIEINLQSVKTFDVAIIYILTAIFDELNYKKIGLRGNLPADLEVRKAFIESGFLNYMTDIKGKRYKSSTKSELMVFEKGQEKLSDKDNVRLGNKIKKVMKHLTLKERHYPPVKTVILEMCGNSIEHADTSTNYWILGLAYKEDKVVFIAIDLGKGILETLKKKFGVLLLDFISRKNDLDVLKGAFIQKYGSKTGEENRNKGLPSIKEVFDDRKISNLIVVTNNVILQYNEMEKSRILNNNKSFNGTFYQWEVQKQTLAS
ncbi:hypothetical protein AB4Y90_05900 [Chryseobacterium sp. 2TAF14]|uniref:hypothetical protein n=1 Tax=Chryseobacterium sp. 2TAF14 TaxID=3233007 RepID=UPI003F90B96B